MIPQRKIRQRRRGKVWTACGNRSGKFGSGIAAEFSAAETRRKYGQPKFSAAEFFRCGKFLEQIFRCRKNRSEYDPYFICSRKTIFQYGLYEQTARANSDLAVKQTVFIVLLLQTYKRFLQFIVIRDI